MSATLQEIVTQPEAWQEAIEKTVGHPEALYPFLDGSRDYVVFTGCGSTYYLSLAAAALFQALTGRPARGVPGSELVLNGDTVLHDGRPLLVAVSRSGATAETLRAVEAFRERTQGPVIAITTRGDRPLASAADYAVVLEKGQEESVVQTRSFAAMYVATVGLALLAARRDDMVASLARLPHVGQRLIEEVHDRARAEGERPTTERFFFLGSGILYGLAAEASLKMKEMSLSVSEPFHFLEFRHGPMSMVDERTTLVGLLSRRNREHEQAVLDEMADLGARVFSLADEEATVAFRSGLPEVLQGVLYLPPLQLMAYYRAVARGLDPDHPRHLSAVVKALDPSAHSAEGRG